MLDETLKRVEREIEAGELGRARDRLQGLLVTYPADLSLRQRLGEVYWRLQYPEKAGLYWYLLPSKRPEMDIAKAAFERRHRNSPRQMLNELRFRGGLDSVRGTYAEGVLLRLAAEAGMSPQMLASLVASVKKRRANRRATEVAGQSCCFGSALIFVGGGLLAAFGLVYAIITLIRWVF